MRSRRPANEEVAEVARRRLAQLSAELAEIRSGPVDPPTVRDRDGSGELPDDTQGGGPRVIDDRPGRHAYRPVAPGASAAGWVHDRLPPTLQGRVRMTGGHLSVVALVVMAALGVSLWWAAQAGGADEALPTVPSSAVGSSVPPVPLSTPTPPTAPGPRAPASPAPGAVSTGSSAGTTAATGSGGAEAGTIVVDVTGKVRRPGIATLPPGSRVVDAVRAAGGARRGASLRSLNLARLLSDGEQIVVGVPAPAGVAASAASTPAPGTASPGGTTLMVNLNTASQAELEQLPGVGPVTALAILDFRAQNGAFSAVDELLEVSGIGEVTLANIAPYVTI